MLCSGCGGPRPARQRVAGGWRCVAGGPTARVQPGWHTLVLCRPPHQHPGGQHSLAIPARRGGRLSCLSRFAIFYSHLLARQKILHSAATLAVPSRSRMDWVFHLFMHCTFSTICNGYLRHSIPHDRGLSFTCVAAGCAVRVRSDMRCCGHPEQVVLRIPGDLCVTAADVAAEETVGQLAAGRSELTGLALWLMAERQKVRVGDHRLVHSCCTVHAAHLNASHSCSEAGSRQPGCVVACTGAPESGACTLVTHGRCRVARASLQLRLHLWRDTADVAGLVLSCACICVSPRDLRHLGDLRRQRRILVVGGTGRRLPLGAAASVAAGAGGDAAAVDGGAALPAVAGITRGRAVSRAGAGAAR